MLGLREIVLLVCSVLPAGFAADEDVDSALYNDPGDECAPGHNSVDIGNRATCTFTRIVNIDPLRMPPEIPSVRCKCPGNRCRPEGHFRCLEVREKIMVFYPNWKDGSRWSVRNTTVDVTTACVCAMTRSAEAHDDTDRPLIWIENSAH
ncbi:hypothetical protein MTO96_019541 [Rhipicephalus appendiculatus]